MRDPLVLLASGIVLTVLVIASLGYVSRVIEEKRYRDELDRLLEGKQDLMEEYDEYGGWKGLRGNATGFFHVERIAGTWWIVDPLGNVFMSKGCNNVNYYPDWSPATGRSDYNEAVKRTYGNEEDWATASIDRLKSWGFNTIGAWSSSSTWNKSIAYTIILDIAASSGADWLSGGVADVFSEEFSLAADRIARERCAPRKDDPWLLGYFLDNELRWGPDWRGSTTLLQEYMKMPTNSMGKRKAVEFLTSRYLSTSEFNLAWGTQLENLDQLLALTQLSSTTERAGRDSSEFTFVVAERYFTVCNRAIKSADPNHMILGCRFAYLSSEEAVKAMAGLCDVVSFSAYSPSPPLNDMRRAHELNGLPVLISEFSFRARDSGLPNTRGAGPIVSTQIDRARGFRDYVAAWMAEPYAVGYHWFEHSDQPKEGRFDGENSNYGLVTISDLPYEFLTKAAFATSVGLESARVSRS